MFIPVYILPTQYPTTSRYLHRLFEKSRLFEVVDYCCSEDSPGINDIYGEANQTIAALEHAYYNYPNNYCLLIKNSSVTNCDIDNITKIVREAIVLNHQKRIWELCYLTKWLDRCDLYEPLLKKKGITKIVKTFSPLGLQAILYSPDGRDIIIGRKRMKNKEYFCPSNPSLGEQISQEIGLENISASAIIPNLFDFNVMLAQREMDVLKLSECRLPDSDEEEEDNNVGPIPFYWFLITVAGIILLAWFFYQFIGKYDIPGTQYIKPIKKGAG